MVPTLSFCITCKNRFHQIQEVLPRNLEDNRLFSHLNGYPNLEIMHRFAERSLAITLLAGKLETAKIPYKVENYIHMSLNRLFEFNANSQELIVYSLLIRFYQSQNTA